MNRPTHAGFARRTFGRFAFAFAALGFCGFTAGPSIATDADTNAEYSDGLPELGDVSELREWFDVNAGAHRLVLLLSPT